MFIAIFESHLFEMNRIEASILPVNEIEGIKEIVFF